MPHLPKLRLLTTSLIAVAVGVAVPAIAAASTHVSLPTPRTTRIVAGVGAGGLRLGQKLLPLPSGWRHPNKCESTRGFEVCTWTSHPEPHMGAAHPATGPLITIAAYHDRIVRFELADDDRTPGRSPLARWRTNRRIGIGSLFSAVAHAYGAGGAGTGPTVYTLPGARGRTQTDFGQTRGIVDDIEINACSPINPC